MDTTADMINRLEKMRQQIEDQLPGKTGEVASSLASLDSTLMGVELQLISRSNLKSDDKWYVEPAKIYMQLIWLSGEVGLGAGDVAGGANHRPTDASLAWLADIQRAATAAKADFKRVVEETVPAFNKSMAGKVKPIATTDKKGSAEQKDESSE
jgi:hypothetical protein